MKDLLKKLANYKKPVIGIAVSAWTRTGPALLLPHYHIICLLETADLDAIRKKCRVRSFAKNFSLDPYSLTKKNTASILKHPRVRRFLKSLAQPPSLLVYKSSKKVENVCQKMGIRILTSRSEIRDPFEDKKEFRFLGKKAGLRLIPGETLLINDFSQLKYQELRKKYGPDLVFQLPDYKVGGGIGTFFIRNQEDYQAALLFIKRRRQAGKKLVWINVTKMIEGTAASICSCVTRFGILSSLVQTQLVDIQEARAFAGRRGVWLGHDWGFKFFGPTIQKRAEKVAQTLGTYMAKLGYKGMFGIDLVIDKEGQIWPVECNARYTGGFPLYSMMQAAYGEIPFDAFHLGEWLDLNYQVNLAQIQEQYRQPKLGAHLVLHNQEKKWVKVSGEVKGGVYQFKEGQLNWLRSGFAFQDIEKKEEFVLCDRAPRKGDILKPGDRLVRVLFKDKIAAACNQLNDWAAKACRKIYKAYQLQEITSRTKKAG
jgi:hypothetical protein